MYKRVVKFFDKCNTLSCQQFSFTCGKSSADVVPSLTEFIYKSLNEKKFVVTSFY